MDDIYDEKVDNSSVGYFEQDELEDLEDDDRIVRQVLLRNNSGND